MEPTNNNKVVTVNKNEVAGAIGNSSIADSLLRSFDALVGQDQIKVPQGYALGNELKAAYLIISQDRKMSSCTAMSIGQALTDMVIQGLEVTKKQCYFIPYGNELKMSRGYFGDQAVAFRTGLVKDINAVVVYDGDDFDIAMENDRITVTKHFTHWSHRDNPIIAAYAVATMPDGSKKYEVMTKKEIEDSWKKAQNSGGVHKEFPQEMSKKTVIRRLVKQIFNTANTPDNYQQAVIASYNRSVDAEYDNKSQGASQESKTTVSNSIIDMDDVVADEATGEVQGNADGAAAQ